MFQVKHLLNDKGHTIFSIAPEEPVAAAIRVMAEHYIGALLVMREGQLCGIISERDYARNVFLKGRSSKDTAVSEIMTSELITVTPEDTIEHCMRLCTEKRVRHLPVIEHDQVIGILSLGDLVKAVISAQTEQIEQLHRYIAG